MARTAPFFPKTLGTADGTVTDFTIGFPFLHEDHLRVFDNGTLKTKGTDYTIQDPTSKVTAKVHFLTAPANTHTITIDRNTPIDQYKSNPQIGDQSAQQALYRSQERDDGGRTVTAVFGQTALLAGTALSFTAPCDGYITKQSSEVLKAITTGGTLTLAVAGATVTGSTITVANAAAVGAYQEGAPSAQQASYTKVRKGQTITVTPASFATAGDIEAKVYIQPGDF